MLKSIALERLDIQWNKYKPELNSQQIQMNLRNNLDVINRRNVFPEVHLSVYYADAKGNNYRVGNRDRITVFINAFMKDYERVNDIKNEELGNILGHSVRTDTIKISVDDKILAEYVFTDGDNMLYIYYDMVVYDADLLIFEKIMVQLFEELQSINSYNREENKERLIKLMQDSIMRNYENNVRDAKSRIEAYVRDIERYKEEIIKFNNNIEQQNIIIHGNAEISKGMKDKIKNDLDLIFNHKKVKNLLIEDSKLIVVTKHLNFFDEKGREYEGGEFTLTIDIVSHGVKIDSTNKRHAGWSNADPHPHVNGRTGNACFGNLNTTLADLFSQKEYYALTLMLINFVESVNISDSAGQYAKRWDVIEDGVNIGVIDPEESEEYIGHCDHCDEDIYNMDMYTVFEGIDDGNVYNERIVCQDCLNESYEWNDDVEEYILIV